MNQHKHTLNHLIVAGVGTHCLYHNIHDWFAEIKHYGIQFYIFLLQVLLVIIGSSPIVCYRDICLCFIFPGSAYFDSHCVVLIGVDVWPKASTIALLRCRLDIGHNPVFCYTTIIVDFLVDGKQWMHNRPMLPQHTIFAGWIVPVSAVRLHVPQVPHEDKPDKTLNSFANFVSTAMLHQNNHTSIKSK